MTATQLFERLASSIMMVGMFGEESVPQPPAGSASALVDGNTHRKTTDRPTSPSTAVAMDVDECNGHVSPTAMATVNPVATMHIMELPSVSLELVCSFLDHASMHAVEATSVALYSLTKESDLWRQLALYSVVAGNERQLQHSWKQMLCLSSGACREDKQLIKGVKAYSSADRSSETPSNTLMPSRCWRDINTYTHKETLNNLHEFYDVPTFVMTLGERIQMRCGCSSGNSCYWSSSASSNKNATDYIDYVLDGPCVISSVQILPYRVFWHPGSPTYGPQNIMIEFYERESTGHEPATNHGNGHMVARASSVTPFFRSPVYPVKNDMELQDFRLPHRVWTTQSTVMRIHVLGRHQAQTFELPQWLQRTEEDRLPKYYCCLSYVNALGLSRDTLASPQPVSPRRKRLRVSSPTSGVPASLAEIMAACFDTMMEQRRRVQLIGSPSG